MVSWKWLLNRKDPTVVVAPERGQDLNPRGVACRIMRLARPRSSPVRDRRSRRPDDPAVADELVELYEAHNGDPDFDALFNRAADACQAFMVAAQSAPKRGERGVPVPSCAPENR